jgi:hypothetical protein
MFVTRLRLTPRISAASARVITSSGGLAYGTLRKIPSRVGRYAGTAAVVHTVAVASHRDRLLLGYPLDAPPGLTALSGRSRHG